ncbi:MAG: hypothetical protein AB1472_03365, partial [Candidatus Omnitrophota bacterium]
KKIIPLLIIILGFTFLSYAEHLRILVMPIEDKTGGYADLSKELTDIVVKEVKKSDYEVVPEYTFFTNWWKATAGAWNSNEPISTLEEYETKKKNEGAKINDIFNHDALGTMIGHKDPWGLKSWGIDLAVIGEVGKINEAIELYLELISIQTGRYFYCIEKTQVHQAKDVIKNEIKALLDKIDLVRKAEVDEELDPELSKVIYNIKTQTGQIIKIKVDYTSDRPNPPIQNVDILPPQKLKEGIDPYRISTKEKKDLIFDFKFKNNKLESVQVSHVSLPDTTGIKYEETLTITSQQGYDIKFIFLWKDNEIISIRCEPFLNPYSCQQVGKG